MINPMQMMMQMMQNRANPMQYLQNMMGQNPQAAAMMQLIQGKTPEQLHTIAANMAKERGTTLDEVARQMGIKLPK